MTRTNKWTVHEKRPQEPKWFTHNGHSDTDPTKVKKNGAGKNNWGQPGDELDDNEVRNYQKSSGRRNSNHEMNQERLNNLNDKLDNQLMN